MEMMAFCVEKHISKYLFEQKLIRMVSVHFHTSAGKWLGQGFIITRNDKHTPQIFQRNCFQKNSNKANHVAEIYSWHIALLGRFANTDRLCNLNKNFITIHYKRGQ